MKFHLCYDNGMKTFIFIAGAPGSGKSTIATLLQQKLDGPRFEFGWIPEFRNTGKRTIPYVEDEALAFENLTLVVKNYAKHGFKNIIITDLDNKRIKELSNIFGDFDYILFTLRQSDAKNLKSRVLEGSRSSGYRNWEEAVQINQELLDRPAFPNEIFIEVDTQSPPQIIDQICDLL